MQDTIRCIVTMLTDDSASDVPGGESLFQELDRPDHGPEVRGIYAVCILGCAPFPLSCRCSAAVADRCLLFAHAPDCDLKAASSGLEN